MIKKREPLNTLFIHFGQVSEIVELRESELSAPIRLTDFQIGQLTQLGKDLAGKKSFYRDDEMEGADSELPKNTQVIRCHHDRDDLYRINVHNAIGVVSVAGLTLHILPKISLSHFAHLASRAYETPRSNENPVAVGSLEAFRDVLAHWCLSSIESLMKSGLVAEYQDQIENLTFVRGRVDPTLTAGNYFKGRLTASCTFDELDIDNALNRILKEALITIGRNLSSFNSDLSNRARNLERRMGKVSPISRPDFKVNLDRHSQHYSVALDLSLRIISGLGVDLDTGRITGKSFLIPTPGLIEAAILAILKRHLSPMDIRKSRKILDKNNYFSINPDIIFAHGRATGDIKYKISGSNWVRNDVAQATMFASGYEARSAVILAFSNNRETEDLEMELGQLRLHRITWPSSNDVLPIVAEEEFVARIRAFLLPIQAALRQLGTAPVN